MDVRKRSLWLLIVGMVGIVLGNTQGLSQPGSKADTEVKVSFATSKPNEAQQQLVVVTLDINKGWHVYGNPVGNADLESNKTAVSVKAPAQILKVTHPAGHLVKDKDLGDYRTWEGKVQIQAIVQRPASGPVEMSVRFQACHEKGICLPPATVKYTIE